MQNNDSFFIMHHGVLGMHWGERNGPPYPLHQDQIENASRTKEDKKEKARQAALNSGDPKKIQKYIKESSYEELDKAWKKVEAARKIKSAAKQEEHEINKKKIETEAQSKKEHEDKIKEVERQRYKYIQDELNSGDLKRIQAVMKEASYQDVQNALSKIDQMNKINKAVKGPNFWDKLDSAQRKMNTVANAADAGIKVYNNFAKIYSSVIDPESNLPQIQGAGKKGKKGNK